MGIKKTLFADQSSNARLKKVEKQTKNTINNSFSKGYYEKNNTETTTLNSSISRMCAGGYVVPAVARHGSARAGYN